MAGGPSRRERRIVTVVFCDLVGFTPRAESMDPEDVEALLRPYDERVRAELERRGGTVEKFIGDLEVGDTAEGLAELDKALAFYRPARATFFLERGEALLAEAQRDSA